LRNPGVAGLRQVVHESGAKVANRKEALPRWLPWSAFQPFEIGASLACDSCRRPSPVAGWTGRAPSVVRSLNEWFGLTADYSQPFRCCVRQRSRVVKFWSPGVSPARTRRAISCSRATRGVPEKRLDATPMNPVQIPSQIASAGAALLRPQCQFVSGHRPTVGAERAGFVAVAAAEPVGAELADALRRHRDRGRTRRSRPLRRLARSRPGCPPCRAARPTGCPEVKAVT
jgi:hypothetical protein